MEAIRVASGHIWGGLHPVADEDQRLKASLQKASKENLS